MVALATFAVAVLASVLLAGTAHAASPGTLASGFGHGGVASLPGNTRLFGDAFQSDGKLVVTGQRGTSSGATLIVGRLTSSGGSDGSFGGGVVAGPAIGSQFGSGSIGRAVAIQSDGKIVVVGKATDSSGTGTLGMLIERFNSNGSLDTSFGSGGVVKVLTAQFGDGYGVAIAPGGKIVAAGSANSSSGGSNIAVVRLNSNGSLDSSFGSGGIVTLARTDSKAQGVAVQSDNKVVIVGSEAPDLQVPNAIIARLTSSGALDSSFAQGGVYSHQYAIGASNSAFNAVRVLSNGSIVAAGAATDGNTGANAVIARFTAGGAPDSSFGHGGVVYSTAASNTLVENTVPGANGLAVASNGDLIAGGTFSSSGLTGVSALALQSGGATDNGFGSGGTAHTSFGSNFGQGNAVAISPTGLIAVAGDQGSEGGTPNGVVVGYNGVTASGPPPTSAFKLSLSRVGRTYKISSVAKHGLKLTAGCNAACSLRASLTISAGTARQLRILTSYKRCTKVHGKRRCKRVRAYRATTIAHATGRLTRSGSKSLTIRLSRGLARTLEKQRRAVKVTLQLTGTESATHKTKTIRKGLTFKR